MPTATEPLDLAASSAATPDLAEHGDTGQAFVGGGQKSKALARRLRVIEDNWELYESRGYRVFDRMRKSDPKVKGLLNAVFLPILGAHVTIESAIKDEKDPGFKRAQEIADFVSQDLFHGMADSWGQTLYQFMLYLAHGFAAFEICWDSKKVPGHWIIDRFAYRPPATIPTQNIEVLNGRVVRVTQVLGNGVTAEPMGAEKLLWFVNEREGDDFTGTSMLRAMFKPWWAKERLEVQMLIAGDKGNGTPVATAPEGGWGIGSNGEDLGAKVDAALAAFGVSETAYFNLPFGAKIELLVSNASLDQMRELKGSFEMDMSAVAMAQLLDLGKGGVGSWALGKTLSDQFTNSLTAVTGTLEDTINKDEGPIHQLVAYNFADSLELIPALRFGSISNLDLKTLAAGLKDLAGIGMTFADETWEWIRAELDLPAKKAEEPSAQQSKTPPQKGAAPSPVVPPEADASQPQDGAAPASPAKLALAEGTYWRSLTPLECFVDLADISARMDAAPAALRTGTQVARDALVAELVRRARAAIATGDPSKVAALSQAKPPMVDKLTSAVCAVYGEAFQAGRSQVASELSRQKAGTPVVERMVAERQGGTIAAATPKQRRPQAGVKKPNQPWPGGQTPAVGDPESYLDQIAAVTARHLAQRTAAAQAVAAMKALSSPTSDEALTEALTRASDAAALEIGTTVRQVMLDGRTVQADAQKSEIADAVYSAILDGNTCGPCEDRDGDQTTDLDEASGWCPNPDCEGGIEKCRCLQIYELNAEGA
jgi:phage gp29-like protein